MGGGMMGPKKKMARGGPVKRMGGGMMGPKKKTAKGGVAKRMGGGMMGPKKKTAKMMDGGMMGPKKKTAKMMGGGMMGPKKKMAKGGAVAKARSRKPSAFVKRRKQLSGAMPTGRSAAAKKLAGIPAATATMLGKFKQGKGNPAGKDLSFMGSIRSLLKKNPKAKSMDMAPRRPSRPKPPTRGLNKLMRQRGKKK